MISVIVKLLEIYNEKISKGVGVTEEERALIKNNLWRLKGIDAISEELKRDFFTHCALSSEYNLSNKYIVDLLCWSGDDHAILQFLNSKLNLPDIVLLCCGIKSREKREQFVSGLDEQLRIYVKDGLTRLIRFKRRKRKME